MNTQVSVRLIGLCILLFSSLVIMYELLLLGKHIQMLDVMVREVEIKQLKNAAVIQQLVATPTATIVPTKKLLKK